jgi:Tol biopolymer transport system component
MRNVLTPALCCLLVATLLSCEKDEVKKPADGMLSKGNDLAWSRDGTRLAIISNDSLFTINKDGSNKILITTGAYSKPSWSADDEYILYQGISNGFSLQLVKSDGAYKKEFAGNIYGPYLPEWSPDWDQISFIGRDAQFNYSVYLVNNDGSNLHKVPNTGPSASIYQVPCWTPDGEDLLFITGFDNEHDMYLIQADGSNLRRLENDTLWEEYAVFVNNGNSILFSSSGNIYRINTDGTGLVSLTGSSGMAFCPRPSPDESMIAFSSYRNGEDGLYIMQADGSKVQKLSSPYVAMSSHAWSPDGKEIAFLASRKGVGDNYIFGVFVVKVPE